MKITKIDAFPVQLPFRISFGHSLAARTSSTNIIVRVTLDDGTLGWGESIPREYVTGEDIQTACQRITQLWAPELKSAELPDFPQLTSFLCELFNQHKLEQKRWGASWCALEIALLDAAARYSKQPLCNLLGQVKRKTVRYGAVLPFCSQAATIAILLFYKLYGFATVKIKVGRNLEEDLRRVELARQILGANATLRVDANCAWSVEQAIEAAHSFSKYEIVSIEQPVAADDLYGMAQVKAAITAEVVADESLCTLHDAKALIESNAAGGFNIRISKVGGILPAGRIAHLARLSRIKCHLGAQVGESGILSAAGRLFACLEEPFENYEGSDNLLLLKQDLTRENLTVGWGGQGRLIAGAGLGLTVLPERIAARLTE